MKIERIYTAPSEHPTEIGFYKHPIESIWLSKDDDRILTETGFVEPSVGGEYKYYIRRHLHVLKLETFLVKPTTAIKLWGNHRDGHKFNNTLENLEWSTTSMNLLHAFATGLRTDNLFGFLTDLESGLIWSFNSLRECARYLDVNPGKLTVYMQTDRLYPFKFKYAIRLLGEPPIALTANDVGKVRKGANKPCKLINKETNEVRYVAYEKSIQKMLNLSERYFQRALTDKGYGDWTFEEISTYEEYVKCLDDENAKIAKSKRHLSSIKEDKLANAKRVKVTNHLTGQVAEFTNVTEFAKKNKFQVGEINRALKTKDSWREFTFEFLE